MGLLDRLADRLAIRANERELARARVQRAQQDARHELRMEQMRQGVELPYTRWFREEVQPQIDRAKAELLQMVESGVPSEQVDARLNAYERELWWGDLASEQLRLAVRAARESNAAGTDGPRSD